MIQEICEAKEPDGSKCWRHAEMTHKSASGIRYLCKMHDVLLPQAVAYMEMLRELRTPEEKERIAS